MKLSEIVKQLGVGELSQVAMGRGENADADIPPEQYSKIIAHLNLGLTTLHRRFVLRTDTQIITLVPGQYLYPMTKGNVLKIEGVAKPEGDKFSLNDNANMYSMSTPSMKELEVPKAIVDKVQGLPEKYLTDQLVVEYRANHPLILDTATADDEVDLPYSHLQALLYFIASRVHNPIGMINEFNMGNNYASKFEQECQRLEIEGLAIDQGGQQDRASRNGWV